MIKRIVFLLIKISRTYTATVLTIFTTHFFVVVVSLTLTAQTINQTSNSPDKNTF